MGSRRRPSNQRTGYLNGAACDGDRALEVSGGCRNVPKCKTPHVDEIIDPQSPHSAGGRFAFGNGR